MSASVYKSEAAERIYPIPFFSDECCLKRQKDLLGHLGHAFQVRQFPVLEPATVELALFPVQSKLLKGGGERAFSLPTRVRTKR